jgi:hypothetical protein
VLPPAFPFGGMENPRVTFVTPTILAGDRSLVSLIAHELAHSWSGNLVSNATWRDLWLNEGTTVYLERRIVEAVLRRPAGRARGPRRARAPRAGARAHRPRRSAAAHRPHRPRPRRRRVRHRLREGLPVPAPPRGHLRPPRLRRLPAQVVRRLALAALHGHAAAEPRTREFLATVGRRKYGSPRAPAARAPPGPRPIVRRQQHPGPARERPPRAPRACARAPRGRPPRTARRARTAAAGPSISAANISRLRMPTLYVVASASIAGPRSASAIARACPRGSPNTSAKKLEQLAPRQPLRHLDLLRQRPQGRPRGDRRRSARSCPPISTRPASAITVPVTHPSSVDFPVPLGPSSAATSPASTR